MGTLAIPRTTMGDAGDALAAFETSERLSLCQAEELLGWLLETHFDAPRSWVGERAAILLRDRTSSDFKNRLWALCEFAEEWPLYFLIIALNNESDWSRMKRQIARASQSTEPAIRIFANEMCWRHAPALSRAEVILSEGREKLGAKSCTFYIRDPWWPDEYRLLFMPGVEYTEPMHGFMFPLASKSLVADWQGTPARYWEDASRLYEMAAPQSVGDNPVSKDILSLTRLNLAARNKLFGSFIQREEVSSCARIQCRDERGVQAALFVNYGRAESFSPATRAEIEELFHRLAAILPEIIDDVKKDSPLPQSQLFRILRPGELKSGRSPTTLSGHFRSILASVFDALGLDDESALGTIHLYDRNTRSLKLEAHQGKIDRLDDAWSQSIHRGDGIVAWVALKQQAILIDDLDKSAFRAIHRSIRDGIRGELAVPILAGGALVGVFNLESRKPRAFTEENVRVISYAADMAANSYLLTRQQLERCRTVSTKLVRMASSESGGADVDTLDEIAAAAQETFESFGVRFVDIWRYDLSTESFDSVGSNDPDFNRDAGPRDDGWSQYVRKSLRAVWISDVKLPRADARFLDSATGAWQKEPPLPNVPETSNPQLLSRSVVCELGTPVMSGDRCVGVLWIKYQERVSSLPLPETMACVQWFADQAAVIIAAKGMTRFAPLPAK